MKLMDTSSPFQLDAPLDPARLIRQRNFAIPENCHRALLDWVLGEDPVLAWMDASRKPIVVQLPRAELERLAPAWGAPELRAYRTKAD